MHQWDHSSGICVQARVDELATCGLIACENVKLNLRRVTYENQKVLLSSLCLQGSM